MSAITFDQLNSFDSLPERNARAKLKITEYAAGQAVVDVVLGGLGGVIPGMGAPATVAAMALQVPFYQKLVVELGNIYCLPPDSLTSTAVIKGAAFGAGGMLAADFGVDFLGEIATDLLAESSLGFAATFIPIVSIFATAALDAAIAATMTWRVGVMASIYFQNGHQWVGDRRKTYKIAKDLSGRLSPRTEDRVDLDSLFTKVPEVHETQVKMAMKLIVILRSGNPDASEKFIREALVAQGMPSAPIEEALRRSRPSSN